MTNTDPIKLTLTFNLHPGRSCTDFALSCGGSLDFGDLQLALASIRAFADSQVAATKGPNATIVVSDLTIDGDFRM